MFNGLAVTSEDQDWNVAGLRFDRLLVYSDNSNQLEDSCECTKLSSNTVARYAIIPNVGSKASRRE
jgi:hypothetical protein